MEDLDFSAESFTKQKSTQKTKRHYIDPALPLIDQAIEAYKMFLSDSFALDYIGVEKRKRLLILNDPIYVQKTKQIRAEQYLAELDEIDALSDTFRDAPNSDEYDLDNSKSQTAFENDRKAWLAGKLKVAEMRRDLRQMSIAEDKTEEAEALNIFFIPISREEFEKMKTTEINDGDDNASSALDDKETIGVNPAEVMLRQINDESEIVQGYIIDSTTGIAEDL